MRDDLLANNDPLPCVMRQNSQGAKRETTHHYDRGLKFLNRTKSMIAIRHQAFTVFGSFQRHIHRAALTEDQ